MHLTHVTLFDRCLSGAENIYSFLACRLFFNVYCPNYPVTGKKKCRGTWVCFPTSSLREPVAVSSTFDAPFLSMIFLGCSSRDKVLALTVLELNGCPTVPTD